MLIGAGVGAGTSLMSGNDPLKGAAIGGAMGGATAGFGGAGVASGAEAAASTVPSHLTSNAANNVATNTMNPALTNVLGQSSNPFTQFGRDASEMATNAYDTVGDTVGQGFDYLNDKTGMEDRDYTMMAMNQGANLLQPTPTPNEPIAPAPVGQGISKPNMDLTKTDGLLSSLPPTTTTSYPNQEPITDLSQLTPEQIMKLKQQGIL